MKQTALPNNSFPAHKTLLAILSIGLCCTASIMLPTQSLADDNEIVPAQALISEQQGTISRKLTGTWRVENKEDPNGIEQTRWIFGSQQQWDSLLYRIGKLAVYERRSEQSKVKYRLLNTYSRQNSQFVRIEITAPSPFPAPTGSAQEAPFKTTATLEFIGDRQIRLYSADGGYIGFPSLATMATKVSDQTEILEQIPIKISDQEAERYARHNVSTALLAQQNRRLKKDEEPEFREAWEYADNFVMLGLSDNLLEIRNTDAFANDPSYSYRIKNLDQSRSLIFAIPKRNALRSYVGIIYINGQTTKKAICGSKKPSRSAPGNPIFIGKGTNTTIQCPRNSRLVPVSSRLRF
jgi:hypothetical protein